MAATPARLSLPKAVGLIFSTAIRRWWACLAIAVVYALLIGLGNALSRSATSVVDPTTVGADEVLAAGISALVAFVVLVLVHVLVFPVTLGALALVGSAAVYGDKIDTRSIVRRALGRSFEAMGAFLILALLLVAAQIVLGSVALAVSIAAGPAVGFSVLNIASMLLALPTLYVFVRLSLAVPVVMREGLGAIASLRRSWQLVAGAWWWVFVLTLIPLAVAALNFVVSFLSFIGPDAFRDFLGGAAVSALCALVSVILYGVAIGVAYASRAPEDLSPPRETVPEPIEEPAPAETPAAPEPETPATPEPDVAEPAEPPLPAPPEVVPPVEPEPPPPVVHPGWSEATPDEGPSTPAEPDREEPPPDTSEPPPRTQ